MIDAHIHILNGLDDGAGSIDDSCQMALNAQKCGFKKIIATPHYIENYLEIGYNIVEDKVYKLNKILQANNISVEVHCGNEIYYTDNIIDILENKKAHTLNNSKYFLMELPIVGMPINYVDVVKDCVDKGYIPVIAHAERYEWFDKGYEDFVKLKDLGVKFQVNYGSIIKEYGSKPRKNVIKMFKNDVVDFICTDAHRVGTVYKNFEKIKKKIISLCGNEKFSMLTSKNIYDILKN